MSVRERRLVPRWRLRAAVEVESDAGRWSGVSYDVSAGGIFIGASGAPPLGGRVAVLVLLPDGTRLSLGGVVRWVRPAATAAGLPAGFGLEWDALPLAALRAMLHFAELQEPAAAPLKLAL